MATCIPFQTQLSSIMEVLVKAAVAEISKLVDDKCAFLHLELSRKQSENEMLKRKLMMMEESRRAQLPRGRGEITHSFHSSAFIQEGAVSGLNGCFSCCLFPENYPDRGSDVRSNCPHPAGDIKVIFPPTFVLVQ